MCQQYMSDLSTFFVCFLLLGVFITAMGTIASLHGADSNDDKE